MPGRVRREHRVDPVRGDAAHLGDEVGAVDDVVGAQLLGPGPRLRPRRGRDDRHRGQSARQLDEHRSDTAGGAHHQQRAGGVPVGPQLLEEDLPRGDRRQRQGGGLGEVQRRRLVAGDPLVDELETGVRAGPRDRPGVVHLVADGEVRDRVADLDHDPRGVEAEDLRLVRGAEPAPDLGVDRVDRDGADLDQEVVARGRVDLDLGVDEGGRLVDASGSAAGDGGRGAGAHRDLSWIGWVSGPTRPGGRSFPRPRTTPGGWCGDRRPRRMAA